MLLALFQNHFNLVHYNTECASGYCEERRTTSIMASTVCKPYRFSGGLAFRPAGGRRARGGGCRNRPTSA